MPQELLITYILFHWYLVFFIVEIKFRIWRSGFQQVFSIRDREDLFQSPGTKKLQKCFTSNFKSRGRSDLKTVLKTFRCDAHDAIMMWSKQLGIQIKPCIKAAVRQYLSVQRTLFISIYLIITERHQVVRDDSNFCLGTDLSVI